MSDRTLSKKELIKQVATEVADPNLRKQLIDAIYEHQEPSHASWKSQPHMAVHPDAVPKNIRLYKWLNAIVAVVFFSIVQSRLADTPESFASYPFLAFMTVFVPVMALIKHIQLSNVSNWQRRRRKPRRKYWGACLMNKTP